MYISTDTRANRRIGQTASKRGDRRSRFKGSHLEWFAVAREFLSVMIYVALKADTFDRTCQATTDTERTRIRRPLHLLRPRVEHLQT